MVSTWFVSVVDEGGRGATSEKIACHHANVLYIKVYSQNRQAIHYIYLYLKRRLDVNLAI